MKFLGQTFGKKDLTHVIPRLIIVLIVGQTLPFKFSGAEESVYIFELMNWEPWGRYLIATIETLAIALLITRFYILGSIITLSIISAANFLHFTRLGFDIQGDNGTLFIMSIVVIICSIIVLFQWNGRVRKKKIHASSFSSDPSDVQLDEDFD